MASFPNKFGDGEIIGGCLEPGGPCIRVSPLFFLLFLFSVSVVLFLFCLKEENVETVRLVKIMHILSL